MTQGYLNVTAATTLDGNGNGIIVLKPDANDWWAPDFIKVSAASQRQPFPYCAVYHVSPGVLVGPTSFIDDTYGGNNDTSSIISGTIVQFGESIVAQFTGGTPGDTAVLTLFGMHSDLPIGMEVVPSSPGTHFTQRLSFAADVPTLIDSTQFFNITNGASTFFPGGASTLGSPPAYQMSHYQSFRMKINSAMGGNKQYYGVQFQWWSDAAATNQINTDYFVFSGAGNDQYGVGIVRGPYLTLRVFNYDNQVDPLTFNLYGSQRSEPRTQFKTLQSVSPNQGLGTDNILLSSFFTIAGSGGSATTNDFNFYNGPVTINAWCSTTPNATKVIDIVLFAEPNGVLVDDNMYEFYIPQGTADFQSPIQINLNFPRRVMKAKIINNGTGSNNVHLSCVAQEL